jgi:plastocyanin domain-containing protein
MKKTKNWKLGLAFAVMVAALGGAFAAASNIVEAHTRTVKIRVDSNGFSPSSIEAEAGHKLNLVFNRADKNNCAGTVVFPKLNVRRSLPVGKDVIVSFTPSEAGQVTFTCGMGMYKGSIVVSD